MIQFQNTVEQSVPHLYVFFVVHIIRYVVQLNKSLLLDIIERLLIIFLILDNKSFQYKDKITMVLGIDFAPLHIPLSRRLQTLAVFSMSMLFACGPFIGTLTFIILLFSPLSLVAAVYITYYFLWDFDISARGGRRFTFLRYLPVWYYFCQYFPIKLVKTAELSPSKNYIFGYHPHGVISSGAFASFATEGAGFSKLFPGIVPHLMTLKCMYSFSTFFT